MALLETYDDFVAEEELTLLPAIDYKEGYPVLLIPLRSLRFVADQLGVTAGLAVDFIAKTVDILHERVDRIYDK